MIKLSPSTLARLRDRLLERGARPSLVMGPGVPVEAAFAAQMVEEYGPLCEAMYLMMSADGRVAESEREVLRGALRELDERVRTFHVDAMLDAAAKRLIAEGRPKRIKAVAKVLADDPVRGEIAFLLAAAVAFADNEIADAENDVLNDLAEKLGISTERAEQLLDQLEQESDA